MRTSLYARLFRELAIIAACAAVGLTLGACADSTPERSAHAAERSESILTQLPAIPSLSVSTVPANGDQNPYGVAFVPSDFPCGGAAQAGDILVSNFNNGSNEQGTGSTIVAVHPDGTQSVFFQGAPGLGLSTALGVLRAGLVIVGNVPSANGTGMCNVLDTDVGPGALTILDHNGGVVQTLAIQPAIDGPWDLTIRDDGDHAALFVSDVLDGQVVRLDLDVGERIAVVAETVVASGYTHRCDPSAFVVGPTGLALDPGADTLYVASTGDNAIFAVPSSSTCTQSAGMGTPLAIDPSHLHGPLGLVLAPNGNLLSTQGDAVNPDPTQPSMIVEVDPSGQFVAQHSINPMLGAAFGLDIVALGSGFSLAAVDDVENALDVWNVPSSSGPTLFQPRGHFAVVGPRPFAQ
jgi:hypothetical protein